MMKESNNNRNDIDHSNRGEDDEDLILTLSDDLKSKNEKIKKMADSIVQEGETEGSSDRRSKRPPQPSAFALNNIEDKEMTPVR